MVDRIEPGDKDLRLRVGEGDNWRRYKARSASYVCVWGGGRGSKVINKNQQVSNAISKFTVLSTLHYTYNVTPAAYTT